MKSRVLQFKLLLFIIALWAYAAFPSHAYPDSIDPPIIEIVDAEISETEVVFTGFSAIECKEKITLSWSTSSESMNKGFVIQRSTDQKSWKPIAFMEGQEKSMDYVDYQFVDACPKVGVNHYRLLQLNKDHSVQITKIVSVRVDECNNMEAPVILASADVKIQKTN